MRKILIALRHLDHFTIVVMLVAIVTVIFFAVQPWKRLTSLRDERRAEDVRGLLASLVEYRATHNGTLPAAMDTDPNTYQLLGTETFGCEQRCSAAVTLNACVDLSSAVAETGLQNVPTDPVVGSDFMTGYAVNVTVDGRLAVVACENENGQSIEVRE